MDLDGYTVVYVLGNFLHAIYSISSCMSFILSAELQP